MASAIGGFFSGLKEGMTLQDSRRRNKAIDDLLELDYQDKLWKYGQESRTLENQGFAGKADIIENKPYLHKVFGFLKNKFSPATTGMEMDLSADEQLANAVGAGGRGFQGTSARGAIEPMNFAADGGYVRRYQHGGEVEDEYNDPYPKELLGPKHVRRAVPPPTPRMDDARERAGGALSEAIQDVGAASTPAEKARAHRNVAGAAIVGGGDIVGNWAADAFGPVAQYLGGLFTSGDKPEAASPSAIPDPTDPTAQEKDKGKPDAEVAKEAVAAGHQAVPGHPQGPDQEVDWSKVAQSGVTPDQIPNMGVKDWQQFRRDMLERAIGLGTDPSEAMAQVDKMQHQGALSNMMQSRFLLEAGDGRGAALAARAAFQYLPNGSDVRFGIYNQNGQPVLIAMGVDEETGEPVMEGKPMILNTESMSRLIENFKNPEAFRLWKKDALDEREYTEIKKPESESKLTLQEKMGGYYDAKAAEANAVAARGGRTAPKQTDFRASMDTIKEGFLEAGLEEDSRVMQALYVEAEELRKRVPNVYELGDDEIVALILKAHETGDPSDIIKRIQGIEQQKAGR